MVDGWFEIRKKLTSWGNRSLSHYVQGVIYIPGGLFGISEPWTVVGWKSNKFWWKKPALDPKTTGRSPDVILLTSIVTACGRATEGSHAVEVFEELKRYRIEATVRPGHVGLQRVILFVDSLLLGQIRRLKLVEQNCRIIFLFAYFQGFEKYVSQLPNYLRISEAITFDKLWIAKSKLIWPQRFEKTCRVLKGGVQPEGVIAWRTIPVSNWLVTPIYKPFSPFGRGISLLRGLTNHGY